MLDGGYDGSVVERKTRAPVRRSPRLPGLEDRSEGGLPDDPRRLRETRPLVDGGGCADPYRSVIQRLDPVRSDPLARRQVIAVRLGERLGQLKEPRDALVRNPVDHASTPALA